MNAEWVPILFIIGVVAMVSILSYLQIQARRRVWNDLAVRTGLTFMPGSFIGKGPYITGTYRGRPLTMDTFSRSNGKSSTTYTRIVVEINNPAGLALKLYEEGVFSKIGKAFGMQDIQVGDDAIDKRFIIKGQPEVEAMRVLSSINLRQKLLAAPHLDIDIQDSRLYFERIGVETDIDELVALFDLFSDLADGIGRSSNNFS